MSCQASVQKLQSPCTLGCVPSVCRPKTCIANDFAHGPWSHLAKVLAARGPATSILGEGTAFLACPTANVPAPSTFVQYIVQPSPATA